jgi:GH24 family phage-related lysozyme (muramidase)
MAHSIPQDIYSKPKVTIDLDEYNDLKAAVAKNQQSQPHSLKEKVERAMANFFYNSNIQMKYSPYTLIDELKKEGIAVDVQKCAVGINILLAEI